MKAQELSASNPKGYFSHVKRLIGKGYYDKNVQRDRELFHYDIEEGQKKRAVLTTKIDKYRPLLP